MSCRQEMVKSCFFFLLFHNFFPLMALFFEFIVYCKYWCRKLQHAILPFFYFFCCWFLLICFCKFIFIFWLLWAFIAVSGLSLFVVSRGCAGWAAQVSHWGWVPLLQSAGSVVEAHGFRCLAPGHVESPWSQDQTHVPCIGRQSLNHWTNREVPVFFFF